MADLTLKFCFWGRKAYCGCFFMLNIRVQKIKMWMSAGIQQKMCSKLCYSYLTHWNIFHITLKYEIGHFEGLNNLSKWQQNDDPFVILLLWMHCKSVRENIFHLLHSFPGTWKGKILYSLKYKFNLQIASGDLSDKACISCPIRFFILTLAATC